MTRGPLFPAPTDLRTRWRASRPPPLALAPVAVSPESASSDPLGVSRVIDHRLTQARALQVAP
jgi:hypothetical protein